MAGETAVTWGKNCDVTVHEREPFNTESAPAALAQTQLTSTAEFYVRNHGPVPELDSHTRRLAVDGLVEHPLELSLQQRQCEFTHRQVVAILQCAGNRRAGLRKVGGVAGLTWGRGVTSTAS